jgi:hypothetical protein
MCALALDLRSCFFSKIFALTAFLSIPYHSFQIQNSRPGIQNRINTPHMLLDWRRECSHLVPRFRIHARPKSLFEAAIVPDTARIKKLAICYISFTILGATKN